jgi:hypothetical protein
MAMAASALAASTASNPFSLIIPVTVDRRGSGPVSGVPPIRLQSQRRRQDDPAGLVAYARQNDTVVDVARGVPEDRRQKSDGFAPELPGIADIGSYRIEVIGLSVIEIEKVLGHFRSIPFVPSSDGRRHAACRAPADSVLSSPFYDTRTP